MVVSNDSVYRSIGKGLAEQLLDEIAAAKFSSGPASVPGAMPFRRSFATNDPSGYRWRVLFWRDMP
ncbi:MAG: hypothetical protein DWI21_05315 [Planctomycetota bacterium]|nr:MAG: hypothetical protein DWI21_05315 [Planctomycetota bacterium]GDY08722.1 hypothetical protein LBMAG52_22080 [Planctomycetia bacterium]